MARHFDEVSYVYARKCYKQEREKVRIEFAGVHPHLQGMVRFVFNAPFTSGKDPALLLVVCIVANIAWLNEGSADCFLVSRIFVAELYLVARVMS